LIKIPRKVILVAAVVLAILVGVTFYLQYTGTQNTGPWVATSAYPLQAGGNAGVLGQSCVTVSSSIYCVGGEDVNGAPHNSTYGATISSSGIGNWTLEQYAYPQSVMFESCVSGSIYVYCVGGTHDSKGDDVPNSYFAEVGANGLGNWTITSPYPVATDSLSCVPSSGYVFCMGGENETSGTNATATESNSVWYASMSPSGLGTWSRTTAYPAGMFFPGCSALGGYIYCLGGLVGTGTQTAVASSYYAAVSPEGLAQWTESTAYPLQVTAQSCTTASTFLYCVGGIVGASAATSNVYYSGLSPSGLGSWQQGGNYPASLSTDCVASSSYVYCIGGYDPGSGPTDSSYFAPISTVSTTSVSG